MDMTLRWYGPGYDSVTLKQIRQIPGVKNVITTLFGKQAGERWLPEEIAELKRIVEDAGLGIAGIESVNVSDDIKIGTAKADEHIDNYIKTLQALGEADIHVVCYNFMPVFDWTRSELARERAKKLFGCTYANVQPHSGAQANLAAFFAMVEPGETVMGMSLDCGGHLSHGSPVNISGKYFNIVPYGVTAEGFIDYDEVLRIAKECKPKMIIAGASAYARVIDFKKFREIADEVGAYLMVDMAHIAGLVAGGEHPSPIPYADVVTTTTHKTLRGPRGGMILSSAEAAEKFKFNKAVFPGIQGGPLMHVIAGKAVCLKEALDPSFKTYA